MGLLNRMRNSGEISSAMLLNGEHFGGGISFFEAFWQHGISILQGVFWKGERDIFGISDEMS